MARSALRSDRPQHEQIRQPKKFAMHPARTAFLSTAIAPLLGLTPQAPDADPAARKTPWDLAALLRVPALQATQECAAPGMRSFFFEGLEYKTKLTSVFAYYAAPAGQPPAGGWPAVVCAHGDDGTAFPDWVKTWNENGYAAISMDLEGRLPNHRGHPNAGPAHSGYLSDIALPDGEHWFYHAVADVVRAGSLLHSFPEINPKRIGLTGISWGGAVACTAAGVDSRWAFVIPVFGCGFLYESDNPALKQWFKAMHPEQLQDYRTRWDPSVYLPHATMPMLWVSGFNDGTFAVNLFGQSARVAAGPGTLCLRGRMLHSDSAGWTPREIYAFADSVVKGAAPLPGLGQPQLDTESGRVRVKATGKLVSASVCYTMDPGEWRSRTWDTAPCEVRGEEVISRSRLPVGVLVFNVNAKDARGYLVSSELVEVRPP